MKINTSNAIKIKVSSGNVVLDSTMCMAQQECIC